MTTPDVRQWLTEIKALQQKLAEVQQERDDAYASAANWRNLYEIEARQRRTEAQLSRQAIDFLKTEIQTLKTPPQPIDNRATEADFEEIQETVDQIQQLDELKDWLTQVLLERDRLIQSLRAEQLAHTRTRQALTTALGDTIEQLNRERTERSQEETPIATDPNPSNANGAVPVAKTPSLELPQFE